MMSVLGIGTLVAIGWTYKVDQGCTVQPCPTTCAYFGYTITGNRRERKRLDAQCLWPKLNWKLNPPPTEHRQSEV
jgi:hypothetical protein